MTFKMAFKMPPCGRWLSPTRDFEHLLLRDKVLFCCCLFLSLSLTLSFLTRPTQVNNNNNNNKTKHKEVAERRQQITRNNKTEHNKQITAGPQQHY
jgi:hypothetical protein